jgi:predicted CopG family antitoxin
MSEERTSVAVYASTWERLNERKDRGDSMDDVINELLDIAEKQEE